MPNRSESEKVQRLVQKFHSLIDACDEARAQWREEQPENFGYYMSDPKIVFGEHALDTDQKRATGAPAQYHFPLVTERVEALVAALNSDDVMLRYVPKIEQDKVPVEGANYTVDVLTRMGNAALEASKTLIDWHKHIHLMVKSTAIFDCHYLGVCLDYTKKFPDPIASIVGYHPWQVFSTPGDRFDEADEVVVCKWVGREELKAQYPELADEIEKLPDFRKYKAEKKESGTWNNVGIYGGKGGIPGYGDQYAAVDNDSVQVMERWKQDTSLVETSTKDDDATIDHERMMIDAFVEGKVLDQEMQLIASGELYFDDYQHHSRHLVDHVEHYEELQSRLSASVSIPNSIGVMTVIPTLDTETRSRLEQAIMGLQAHIQMTQDAMDDIPVEKEGMHPKFEGGWRQTCIIGDRILAYDGPSIFYTDYGIQGVPIWEFELMGHPLYHKGPSYVRLLIDYNKILDSTINQMIDNGRLFSNLSWWMDEEYIEDIEINNDPRRPIKIPEGAKWNVNFGLLPAQELPSSLFQLIGLDVSMAQSTSAIHPALEGNKQSGVRSGVQQQTQVTANLNQLMYKMTRLKPSLEKLGTAFFKMVLIVPPDDMWVKPIIEKEVVKIDWDVLKDIDFSIDVVIKPGGVASAEERQQITLGFLQNFGPLMMQIGMLDVMLEFMAESIKYTMPDMALVIKQNVEKVRQAQQQQQMMQQQQAAMGQAQNTQGVNNG